MAAKRKIQALCDRLSLDEQAKFGARFNGRGKETEFVSAIFELLIYFWLENDGNEVEYSPEIQGLTPDFIVSSPTGKVIIEASVLGPPPKLDFQSRQIYDLNVRLGPLLVRKGYHIDVLRWHAGNDEPDLDAIACFINIAAEAASRGAVPPHRSDFDERVYRYEDDNWMLELRLRRGDFDPGEQAFGMISNDAYWDPTTTRYRARIEKKLEKYCSLGLPVVVASTSTDEQFAIDETDAMHALVGRMAHQFVLGKPNLGRSVFQPTGIWGQRDEAASQLAGAILLPSMKYSRFDDLTPVMWLDPFAPTRESPFRWSHDIFRLSENGRELERVTPAQD